MADPAALMFAIAAPLQVLPAESMATTLGSAFAVAAAVLLGAKKAINATLVTAIKLTM